MGRVGLRLEAYRRAAERERDRREREAEERAVAEAHAPSPPPASFPARTRRTVVTDALPPAPDPEAAGGAGDVPPPPGGTPAEQRPAPAEALPWGVRVAAEAGWRLLVLAAVVWVLIQAVSAVSLIVIAFAAGLLVTALLQPMVGRLKRWGVGRGAATAITSLGGFGVIGLSGWFVVWQVMENIDDLVQSVQEGIDEFRNWLLESPFGVTDDQLNEVVDNLNAWIGDNSAALTSAGFEGVTYLVQFLTGAGIALFVVLFLLYDGRNIWYWFLKFIPAAAREGVAGAGPRAWITLTGYVRGTVLVALIDAVGIWIGLYFLDVPMAVPLAVIVFLSAFVPIVGAIASGALATVVAFVTDGFVTAMLVLMVVLIVQQVESQILQPFILGRMVRVHPLAVVLSVTGGTLLAGIPGAVVAVPLVAVVNTVVTYLRAYHAGAAMRLAPSRAGATIAPLAPTPPRPSRDRDEEAPRPETGPGSGGDGEERG
ncbi:AI-2E family transporter [Streptomyces sodiiphilus]|uniref:AI-2E family transporter n=1 Tax=Streptomyces sodiiphilus TaxID=226217 RepID=A0ABN2NW39_9ACTN